MDSTDAAIFQPRDIIYQDGTLGHLSVKELFSKEVQLRKR